jgi:hypothetical protein
MGAAILGHVSRRLVIGWLYPDLMNIYGDRGNILALARRAEWRGFDARVLELGKGAHEGIDEVDIFFFGGGQDREQAIVYDDLLEFKAEPLSRALGSGAAMLAVCGGYQLLGHYYQTADGERFDGLGLLDLHTEGGARRCIGDVVVDVKGLGLEPPTLVGFENHSGRTFLGPGLKPLGRVLVGSGNNGEDGGEGVIENGIVGTYLHGSLLPKNPHLADHLVAAALRRRGLDEPLTPLDDGLELDAHRRILDRELAAARK